MSIAPATTRAGAPTSAFIQLSDHCNHACTHCYQVHGERGEMSTDEISRVMDEMAAAGVLFLTLTGGEVTLRSDFLPLVAHARKRSFAVRVYSNAYRVDDEMARSLAELAVLEVHVSVYSAHPADHDSVTLVPGSFEKTLAGVRALRRHGVKVVLKVPVMRVNSGNYSEIMNLAESLGCQFTLDPMIDVREDGHVSTAGMRASPEAITRFYQRRDLGLPAGGARLAEKPLDARPCGACEVAYVTSDGTVRPCTSLPFEVGHVASTPYAELFSSSATARFVASVTWGDLPACSVCDLRRYCSRCHAAALLEDGDMFGPSSNSCRIARAAFHGHTEVPVDDDEPMVGPYHVGEGRLTQKPYERVDKQVPPDVKWAVVQGKPKDTQGKALSRPRVRLPVLGNG